MNVQQINKTGSDIWVFVVTALVLTILAISGWGLSNAIQKKWASMDHEKQPLSIRWSHIKWLVLRRRFWRNFPFGLLLGLMTDGRYGVKSASHMVGGLRGMYGRRDM